MMEQLHCHYCASAQQVVEVHGHRQCVRCGINIDPCCSGEQGSSIETGPHVGGGSTPHKLLSAS